MKVVTVATHSEAYYPFLVKSCERNGITLDVLGWGQPWTGFSMKFQLMKQYVSTLEDHEIVCFVDSFDVIALRPLEELQEMFIDYSTLTGHRVIVGCDKSPSRIVTEVNKQQFGTCHGISLNSGTYIGYAKNIKHLLQAIYSTPEKDDQVALTHYVATHPHAVHIDTGSLFFITLNNPTGDFLCDDRFAIKRNQLYYRGLRPFFAHGNGNTNMNRLIQKLGYPMTEKVIHKIQTKSHLTQFIKVMDYYSTQLIAVGIILAIVFFVYYKKS